MKKCLNVVALMLSLFLFFPVINSVEAATDLSESHSFYEEIQYLMENGVLRGYSDGTMRPNSHVTRAEAAVMIGRLKGLDGTKKATQFTDVPASHFASGYIAEAAEANYIFGYSNGTFLPNQPITRGDMALIVERVFTLSFIYFHDISDVPDSSYYYNAICRLVAANIAIGYPDGTFRPQLEVTRSQFSAFLARALEPEFKNNATIADSYQRDKTKTYTYRTEDGGVMVDRFIQVPSSETEGEDFVWESRIGEEVYHELEYETHQAFAIGYPYSESSTHLVYPIQVGETFIGGYNPDAIIYTITGVGQTVETEYQTFTDAVEITTPDGGRYYMVEGYAVVKWIKGDGAVYADLISVE